jgi:iron(III) transport system permease protein
VPLAFVSAYALTRSCLPLEGVFETVALIPILVPSMLPGIAVVSLFEKGLPTPSASCAGRWRFWW